MPRSKLLILILLLTYQSYDVTCRETSPQAQRGKLLLILLDGFRSDYVKENMNGFAELKKMGVHAKYLLPVFPSMSFPNYYSLVTGLYTENHGMVMNYMYDTQRQELFMMLPHPNSSQSFWWEKAQPMWITATQNKLKTHLYLWPGGDVQIHGTLPSFALPYAVHSGVATFRQHLDDALQNLRSNASDLAQVYCEHTDYVGHRYGPESKQLADAVEEIDKAISDMIGKLRDWKLINRVNVVIVSDHGMTSTDKKHVKTVSFESYFQINRVQKVLGEGAVVGVYPQKQYLEEVYHNLSMAKEFYVWKKDDIPEEFHIKNNERTPPILVLAKKGYFITAIENTNIQVPFVPEHSEKKYNGYHGYDVNEVKDMRGIFYAFGPGLESDMKIGAIHIVDVYNVMMHLLDLKSQPNNGSWTSVFKIIRAQNSASVLWQEGISGWQTKTLLGGKTSIHPWMQEHLHSAYNSSLSARYFSNTLRYPRQFFKVWRTIHPRQYIVDVFIHSLGSFQQLCPVFEEFEFQKIAMATAIGFAIMGFIGFFVKLIHIPINNIIVGS